MGKAASYFPPDDMKTLSSLDENWDDPFMIESEEEYAAPKSMHDAAAVDGVPDAAAPTTRQMQTVGQRRRDAELKLEQHLEEARHKGEPHDEAHQPPSSDP